MSSNPAPSLVVTQDRSIVALLGASTAAAIAIGVLETHLFR